MTKLWQKSAKKLHPYIEKFTVGDDHLLDTTLMPYDIEGTKAHIKGLTKIGLLKKDELKKLISALHKLEKEFKAGKIKIKIQDEDCHTVIENYLSKKYKALGKKIHTGRSRNDQVLTAIRLYLKDSLDQIRKEAQKLAQSFLEFAIKHQKVPMPGYTHTQQAMLSSVGHYFCAYTESLTDDIDFLDAVYHHIDKSPLGSAAGYGVPLLLAREFTKRELKFKQLQINSLYCQNSRGKFESIYLEGLAQIMLTLNKFASDIILFTSQEFSFFKVKSNLVTGSSIMPQKRNLDGLEILRAKLHGITANQTLIKDICKNLISGYHRDLQLIKKPLIESTNTVLESLEVAKLYLNGLEPNMEKILKTIKQDIFTADLATEMAKKIPFRDAYKLALKEIKKHQVDPQKNLATKISLGAPGNLDLNYYKNLLFEEKKRPVKAKKTTKKES